MFLRLGALALFTFAAATAQSQYEEHEAIRFLPAGWSFHSTARPSEPIRLRLVLRHPHQDYLEQARDISNPSSPSYGQYLDHIQLRDVLPNLDESAGRVLQWLSQEGIESVQRNGDDINMKTTVARAGQLLNTTFSWYQFQGQRVLRTQAYWIPSDLQGDIDFVWPAVNFMTLGRRAPKFGRRQHLPPGPPNCTNSVCPQQIKDAYQIDYIPEDGEYSRVGVAGFLEQYGNHADLASFFKQFGLQGHNTSYDFSEQFINGGKNPQDPTLAGVEANLDLQYVMAFTNSLPVTYYSVGGRPPTQYQPGNVSVPVNESGNEPYLEFLNSLLCEKDPPQVISISYSDDEATVPQKYAEKVCSLFAQLAMRGVSVLIASGDGGAAGSGGNTVCTGPDGINRAFRPTFPSSCPWVTSVGGTIGTTPDQPASFSSGGFSNYFGTPEWQQSAVKGYQEALGDKHKGYYNPAGRGIPDVSAMGDDYLVVTGGFASAHDGTSASTPVVAAIIALLNDIRIRSGKPALGFLNPMLYGQAMAGFKDVVDGEAGGCSDGDVFESGFEALAGWDASTGVGTPIFPKLRELLATF